jgi:hypothetical protein
MSSPEESPEITSRVAESSFAFVDQENIRAEQWKKWKKYSRWVSAHIPYEVSKSNGQDALPPEEFIPFDKTGDLAN